MKKDEEGNIQFPVMEIFGPTIQGEGAVIGMQTHFIRLGGCDYRCKKCDSLHAVLPELVNANAAWMSAGAIVDHLSKMNPKYGLDAINMITLSGGNPAMWDLTPLISELNELGLPIAVETQGTIWQDWLLNCDFVTISPKGPGMGEQFEANKFDAFIQKLVDAKHPSWSVKIVCFDQRDIEFCKEVLDRWPILYRRFFISVGNPLPPKVESGKQIDPTAEELLECYSTLLDELYKEPDLLSAIVLPQMHVLLWGNKQGV